MTHTSDPIILMCPPEYYSIFAPDPQHGHANDFAVEGYKEQQKDPAAFLKRAKKEWNDLKAIFNALGVCVKELEPSRDNTGLVFTADPSLSLTNISTTVGGSEELNGITLLSHFTHERRQGELDANIKFFEAHMPHRRLIQSHYRTEGTGDNVYDPFRDVFWSGYTPNANRAHAASGRSDVRAHETLSVLTGVPVISMAVKKPFFHIDTSMATLSRGHIVCFPDGMQPEAYKKLISEGLDAFGLPHDEYLIKVSAEDAAQYACNLRCVDNTIILPNCSTALQDRLKQSGYEVVTTSMTHFIYTGGAIHCITNNVNERRIKGGTAHQMGFERLLPKVA